MEAIPFRQAPFWKRKLYLSTKPYFMVKDRVAGERDLVELAAKERFEVSFLYIPSELRWLNCTYAHMESDTAQMSETGVRMLAIIPPNGERGQQYHTHPRAFEEKTRVDALASATRTGANDAWLERIPLFIAAQIAFPSDPDIQMYQITTVNRGSHIASPYGLTTVATKKRLPRGKFEETATVAIKSTTGETPEDVIKESIEITNRMLRDYIELSFRTIQP